jgi:hypothetical protein
MSVDCDADDPMCPGCSISCPDGCGCYAFCGTTTGCSKGCDCLEPSEQVEPIRLSSGELISGQVNSMAIGQLLARFKSIPDYLKHAATDSQKRVSLRVSNVSLEELYRAIHSSL